MKVEKNFSNSCPTAFQNRSRIILGHGGGGKLTHELIDKIFIPALKNTELQKLHDGAVLDLDYSRIAFTTDSYVVRPIFFPGGNIGTLAVYGTVNDLAMCGAEPRYLSLGLILEEGFPVEHLEQVIWSIREAGRKACVEVVTGDTKVVEHGKGDGIYINTAGIGIVSHSLSISPVEVRPGDAILLSGDIGSHGVAIMAAREGLNFETTLKSDCAPLHEVVAELLKEKIAVHCMRDLTRGGLATALVEIADSSCSRITIDEVSIPISEEVKGACEILGLDPMYVANEGRFVAFVDPDHVHRALEIMWRFEVSGEACQIGAVAASKKGLVTVNNRLGTARLLDMLSGEQLPRIC